MKEFEKIFRGMDSFDGIKIKNDDFDEESINDVDFSEIAGRNFRKSFSNVTKKIKQVKHKKKKSLTKTIPVDRHAFIHKTINKKSISKVLVPRDRKTIVQGVGDFILNDKLNSVKDIDKWDGKQLKQIVFIFNNNSALPFNLELFNPSEMMDYLYCTSQMLNSKIQVDGGKVSYTDVLFNCLANPPFIYNAKFIIDGPLATEQIAQPLTFINKNSRGKQITDPIQLLLHIDNMQVEGRHISFFEVFKHLQRPFIPDGMDVIGYKVLPGNTITMAFFCKQPLLKERLFKEAKHNSKLL